MQIVVSKQEWDDVTEETKTIVRIFSSNDTLLSILKWADGDSIAVTITVPDNCETEFRDSLKEDDLPF